MVNRLLMDANGLKISAAGSSVITAAEPDLLFSSGASQFNVIARGRLRSYASGARSGSDFVMLPSGYSFSTPPLAVLGIRQGNFASGPVDNIQQTLGCRQTIYVGRPTNDYYPDNQENTYYWWTIYTMTDRVKIEWWHNPNSSLYGPAKSAENVTYFYAVMDYAS